MSILNLRAPISPYAYPGLKMEVLTNKERAELRKVKKKPTDKIILNAVSEYFSIPAEWIKTKTRKRPIVWARQVYFLLCLNNTGMTLVNIGLSVGITDHTTVCHGRDTAKDVIETSEMHARQFRELQGIIKNLISNES
jgi:chromosomal replication initiator protein